MEKRPKKTISRKKRAAQVVGAAMIAAGSLLRAADSPGWIRWFSIASAVVVLVLGAIIGVRMMRRPDDGSSPVAKPEVPEDSR